MQQLFGCNEAQKNPEHLQSAVDALNITLTAEEIERIDAAIPADKVLGKGRRNFRFMNGQMTLVK